MVTGQMLPAGTPPIVRRIVNLRAQVTEHRQVVERGLQQTRLSEIRPKDDAIDNQIQEIERQIELLKATSAKLEKMLRAIDELLPVLMASLGSDPGKCLENPQTFELLDRIHGAQRSEALDDLGELKAVTERLRPESVGQAAGDVASGVRDLADVASQTTGNYAVLSKRLGDAGPQSVGTARLETFVRSLYDLAERVRATTSALSRNLESGAEESSQQRLFDETRNMQESEGSFNLEYLRSQSEINESAFTAVSNIQETSHDTVRNSVSDIRGEPEPVAETPKGLHLRVAAGIAAVLALTVAGVGVAVTLSQPPSDDAKAGPAGLIESAAGAASAESTIPSSSSTARATASSTASTRTAEASADTAPSLSPIPIDSELVAALALFSTNLLAAKSAQEDLKDIMNAVAAMSEEKEALRQVTDRVNSLAAQMAGVLSPELDRGLQTVSDLQPKPEAMAAVALVPGFRSDVTTAIVTAADLADTVSSIEADLSAMAEMGEAESLRLQMAMDRASKLMTTLSNLLKEISDTAQGVTQNLE